MKALCWQGAHKVGIETVPDPHLINPRDIIVKVSTTAICGSDLHLYSGKVPTLLKGDILGHEFMGEVVETGAKVKKLKVGDRVVVPFNIACGECRYCANELYSLCDNSNPNSSLSKAVTGHVCAGLFGYSHMCGGYAGGQAEYVRVPFGDVGPLKVPETLDDTKVLFLSDIFPTGYMAAENCEIRPGQTVAIWGGGPVGQFAVKSAQLLGAERIILIDGVPERLTLAAQNGAETVDYTHSDVFETLCDLTSGEGPDACIDAVGMEAYGHSLDAVLDYAKSAMRLQPDRAHVLRQMIRVCRKGGVLSIPGVYVGFIDKVNFGMAFNKGLRFKMGQTHTQKYMAPLLERIERNEIDPSFIISHRLRLDEAPEGYQMFQAKQHHCTKVVMHMH